MLLNILAVLVVAAGLYAFFEAPVLRFLIFAVAIYAAVIWAIIRVLWMVVS